MTTQTTCPACAALNGLTQCNRCRVENPNAQTVTRNELLRLIGTGMTPAEAEARLNVVPVMI